MPDWAKPYVGWAVGMDWPEGDESRCFRLADACAATARSVAGEGPLSSQGSMGAAGGVKWDGEALKLFAEHVKKVSGGRQAELVDRLVSAALELNQAGVQVEYTKKMIEVSVWFLIFQIGWLLAASAGPWGALSLALIGPRVQLARMTIQQIAHRLLINLALFGGLGVVMDAGVQLSQSRRDGIDWESVKASGMMGALSGLFLTALPAGLSGLSTARLRAGLRRAEMTAFEKFLAASTSSMWGMMAQSGLANGAATAISLAMSGQFDWEMVLKGTTAGVIGGADAHWAGQPTVRGAGGDGGGPAHGGDGGGPAAGPAGGSPAGGTVPRDPGGPSGPGGAATHDPGGPSGPGGTVPHDPGGPPGSGGAVPRDPGGPSGRGAAGDLGAVGAHQAGSGRPADSATVLAQAVPPAVLGADGTASPHTPPHTAPQAVPPVALRPDGTAPPHAAPPAPLPAAAAPAFAAKPGGGPAGRVENAGPVSAGTPGEGGSPAHPATATGRPGQAHVAADDATGPGSGGATHSGTGTATHPGTGTATHPGAGGATHPGTGTATHPGAGGATHPGPEAAVPTVPAPRDPIATGESAPAARPGAESIDSLINHGDGQGTATVLTEQQGPPAPQPFPAADPEAVRPPRPITLRDHESFAQSVATGITGPREPLRTGAESLRADRVTLGDGTRAVDKELAGRDARDREYLTSRLGQAVGADVAAVHIAGERRVLVDWVGGERAEVRLNPDGSWEAPGHHGTADGILLGLLDTLTSHYDRFRFPDADLDLRAADIDLRVGENGALRAFDHEKAFQGILPDTRNPFVRHFFRETSPMKVEWAGNPLSRSDIEVLRVRIDALEGEFRALGRDDWYANAKFAFDRIAEHAEGTTPLLDAAREPAGPGRAPSRADGQDALPGSEEPASSGGARDRTPEGEARDRTPEGEARGVTSRNEAPSPGEAAARLMDPGGELGRSAAGGVRHTRLLDVGDVRAEIVTFGDGRTAMRLTGRDAEAAEAAALTRVALGLDGPAVHRSGDVVYREYGDDALRRSIETGIRETRLIPDGNRFRELVTFNDGRQAFRIERRTIDAADAIERAALPPLSTADASGGIHRASETVVYETRVKAADDPDVKPLVWSESPGHEAKRGLYDVLTLGETFNTHTMETNAHGEPSLRIERSFADTWDKKLLDGFLDEGVVSQLGAVDFGFRRNGLTGEDAAAVAARLEALRPEFERRGWQRWHDDMTERFEHLGRQAQGDQPLLTGADAVPHGPVLPDATPHDGAASPVVRSADAEWPYDPATTRPDEALERVLRDGDLRWLNEALADPAAHPDDTTRARAYAELVDEGLAELPRSRGTVQVRVPVDRLPEGLSAGQEFTARGFLEGVDDPRFLPDMDRSARLVVYGEHTRVGDLSGKPHQVMFEGNSRFKVLGVHETSYGVKEYFVARVSDVEGVLPDTRTGGLSKAPPELPPWLQRHFDEHREVTDAGVWYRDLSDPEDRDLAESARAVRGMDGLFYVDAHGDSDGIYIGEDGLNARELAMLLLNEPGLRPDDVIYLGNCEVGQRAFAQELARETGHVVIAADSMMSVNQFGDMNPVTDGKARTTMAGRGQLLVFLPDVPVPPVAWERVQSGLTGPLFFSDGPGAHGDPQAGIRAAESATRAESAPRAEPAASAEFTTRAEPVTRVEPVPRAEPATSAEPVGRAEPSRPASSDVPPPARTEPSSGRPDPVDTARPVRGAGEDATPSGEARDRASEGEMRNRASEDEARDAASADGPDDAPFRSGAPSPDEAAARLMDPGGELGRSAAGGVRHSRLLDAGETRAEIVTFGDGRTAMRLTGRDAETAEAAALTRAALGLDGPAVHRSGDVVYREYGDDALRRSIETGIRRTEVIRTGPGRSLELVTFNDGVQARRVDCGSIAKADRVEAGVLPPRTVADPNGGVHRASETVIYRSHLSRTDVAELRPLVRDESHGHAAKRGLYDVLTLGETFNPHRTGTNASGEHLIGVDRDFAGRWGKSALDDLLRRPTSAGPGDFVFRHNGLYWTDVVAVHARLEELRPEFERRGWQRWHDDMVERLELLGRHAGGEKALLTGPDAVPHGPVLPDTAPHDGAGAPAAHDGVTAPAAVVRPADAGWPRDPAGMRPRQALVELLWEGDLRRLNEVLADPAAHPDDVARARAYAELVGAGLVELPRSQGTVQVRVPVDRLPEGLAAGREFTARGILEGVDDPRFLPDMPHSARLIIHGDHTRVADLSGRPGHVMIEGDARFKVLGVHETSYGVKEYFVTRVTEGTEGGTTVPNRDVRPKERPELPDRLQRHITTNREVTDAGVWYRTPEEVLKTDFAASVRAVRKMDGVFYVDGHGNSRGIFIGGEHIPAADLAAMLLNEPGLRPDDVIYLGECKVGAERYAQEVANRTGHVVVASETLMHVSDKSGDMVALRPDHWPGTMAGRGRLLIFLPEGPVPPAAWEGIRSLAEAPPSFPDGPGGPGGLDGTRPGPGGEHGGPLSRSADEHGALRHRPDEARETPGAGSSGTPDPSHSPDAPGPSRVPDEPAPGAPNPSHSPDAPAVPVRDDGLAASVAGGVRETRVVERGGTRVEIVAFEDGRQAIRLTGRDADAAEMAALVRGAMGMDGPATHRAGDVVYRDCGNEALRRSLATGILRSELFENAQGRMEELVTFNDGRQAVRTEYIRAADADGHELTGLPPRFTGAADSGILRAGETVVYSEHRVSTGDPRPEGAAWHESPAERTRRGMYTVLTMGDGFARHEVTVDAHGVHHLRVGEELPARWGGPATREFLVAHRSPEAAEPPRVTFRQNRLSPEDAAAVSARLEALRPEFARRGRLDWHDGLMDRLGHLARHADGERPVLDGLDGLNGLNGHAGTGGHAPEAGDWRSRDPRAALSELLTHGDLPEVHDALAGRTGDPGDAARAGAYLDLANAELAGLPHRTGQVEVRVPADRLPGDLAPGREVAFRGLLEGVDDPRFLADAPGSVRLTIRGHYANVGDISGKPHHAMFDANARFKVLAVQESSSGAKNYFLAQVGEAADAPAAQAGGVPRPKLTGEALRHFTEHREATRAGVWYRDPDSPHDMANAAASRGALPVDGAFPVFAHGGPEGVYIGGRLLPAEEFAALLLNEPGLRADDVLLLADCEVGHATSSYAQEVADRTGRVVLAPDAFYGVTKYGDGFVGSIQEAPHSLLGRGRLRIFLPEGPVPLTTWEKVRAWVGSGRPEEHPETGAPDTRDAVVNGDAAGRSRFSPDELRALAESEARAQQSLSERLGYLAPTIDYTSTPIHPGIAGEFNRALDQLARRFSAVMAELNAIDVRDPRNRFGAEGTENVGAYSVIRGPEPGIHLDARRLGDPEAVRARFEANMRAGWLSHGWGSAAAILYHEFGHHLLERLPHSAQQQLNQVVREVIGRRVDVTMPFHPVTAEQVKAALSKYGATDPDEMVAEAFAEYMASPRPRPLALAIGRFLESHYAGN
ncbi:hypothetical protein GCM10027187_16440 [Streptosporangium sandarakinum]